MIEPSRIHADLIAYCARIGIAPTTFGQWVVRDFAFAASLLGGSAKVGKVALAQRFMRECPEVPRRQFGAVAKAWRERIMSDAGVGGDDPHAEAGQMVAGAAGSDESLVSVGSITAGTLEQAAVTHNRESYRTNSGDPGGLARILGQLGGHAAVAAASGVPVSALEAMEAEGRVWDQHRRALQECAARLGYDLDPETLACRPLGRAAWNRRTA